MRAVRVEKTGMRATRSSLPLVALVILFAQTHAQKYILCKRHGSEDCQLYSSNNDDIVRESSDVCGVTSSYRVTRLRDQFLTIESLGLVKGLTKKVFCKKVIDVTTAKQHETFVYYRTRYPRARRQATFTPRGRYRGQTQSQYLAIDRGNGKDEGKAEALSAADSSRASVSGNSGMGQAQSQSIYDPSCDDCYGSPRQEGESLRRQPGRTNAHSPGWSSSGPEYSSHYPGRTSYNPDQTALNGQNGKPYIGSRYGPDGKIIPGSDNHGTSYGPGGANVYPYYNNYGTRGTGSSYPGRPDYEPVKSIPSGGVGPDRSFGNGVNPLNRFSGMLDKATPGENLGEGDANPLNAGKNYRVQQSGYPTGRANGNNGVPIHDFNGQAKSPSQGFGGTYPPNDYISGQPGKSYINGQHSPNENNNPTLLNTNDGLYYNPSPSGSYSPGQTRGENYVPNGSSLPPDQLKAPFNSKLIPDNGQLGANGQAVVPQQTPTGTTSYGRNAFPPVSYGSGGNQLNWPPSGPFRGPDGKTYVCCEATGMSRPDAYGPNSAASPNNLLAPGSTGFHSTGNNGYVPGSRGVPGNGVEYYSPGFGTGRVQNEYKPEDGPSAGAAQPGGPYGSKVPGEQHNFQNSPRQYSPEIVSGSQPGGQYQYTTRSPGGQYGPGSVQTGQQFSPGSKTGYETDIPSSGYRPGSGSDIVQKVPGNEGYGVGAQYNPRDQNSPGRGSESGITGPGRQYTPGGSPDTGSGGDYIPGRNLNSGIGNLGGGQNSPVSGLGGKYVPGREMGTGLGSTPGGQYVPGRDVSLGTGGPRDQYSPSNNPNIESGGQYFPGKDMGPGPAGRGGQYSPGSGPAIGFSGHGQYIPGGDVGSGTGGPTGQYSPSSGPTIGSGGKYIPGRDMDFGAESPRGQYPPSSRPTMGAGGQYIPGRDMGSRTGGPEGQYSPNSGPDLGSGRQYIPGNGIGSGIGSPEGRYSPGSGPAIGSNGQYLPGRDMDSGTGGPGGQYPGSNPAVGSIGQYIPGGDISSGSGGPGSQYSRDNGPGTRVDGKRIPGTDLSSGTGGQYSPGNGMGTVSGKFIPGINSRPGEGSLDRTYSPGSNPAGGSGQFMPSGVPGSETSMTGGLNRPRAGVPSGSQYDVANGANFRPDSGNEGATGQYTPSLTGSGVNTPGGQSFPDDIYGYKKTPDNNGGGEDGPYTNFGSIGRDATGRYPNGHTGTQYEIGGPNPTYNSVPQNYVDPQSVADNEDSEAEAVVSQAINGTTASASSKGGNDKGRAQTHVQGTYSGSGSFQAQAQIAGENKEAESEVSGGKKGASSSATGSGRNNKSQASVQLGSETGAVQTNSLSSGVMHSSNSQVQGSVKGGTADAQARGPGSTSSQAQIGFTPYKDNEKSKHDLQKTPFVGGGIASAQSSGRTGQSQSQLHGTFKYGITYNGAAQAGASIDKDAIFPNRLSFEKIDVFNEKDKNINVDLTEPPPEPETEIPPDTTPALPELAVEEQNEVEITTTEKSLDETLKDSESRYDTHSHADHHTYDMTSSEPPLTDNRRSFHNYYGPEYDTDTTDKEDNDDYDSEGAFIPEGPEADQGAEYSNYDEFRGDATHQALQSPRKGLEVHQSTGGNSQHIVLGSLKKYDAEITQKSSERPDEKRIYQPGERVPGTGGYTIPIGFTGSVQSVASKNKTYVVGSRASPSQAQTVTLTPGTGKVRYPSGYAKHVHPTNLRSLNSKRDDDRYVSVSKSVTRDLDTDDNIRKQYSHTYYTKSSSCGYFTFTCTMVSSAEGKKKVCKPKIPTNPDGTPIRC